jgi:hypothetical protein
MNTPRTDAEIENTTPSAGSAPDFVSADFARTLERELKEAREIAKKYEDRYFAVVAENATTQGQQCQQ